MLKRVPKEYQDGEVSRRCADEDLHRWPQLDPQDRHVPDFDVVLAKAYSRASGYTGFLCDAIGLSY